MTIKRISVIGLGKLGAPMAACFALKGFPTIGVDRNSCKVKAIRRGTAPIFEPGLREIIQAGKERLTGVRDYSEAVTPTDATFIVVPTPSKGDGSFSLRYVLEATRQIADVLRKKPTYHLVVLTSTVLPGSMEGELKPLLEARSGKKCGRDFGLCYNPQLIALGSVIRNFLNPDFVLIGESDHYAGKILEQLYKKVCENFLPVVARMNFVNAELAKLSVNAYVTTKISFANMLARICERLPGANVDVVTSAIGLDKRIGHNYLKGAIGYGGPCFPRDNTAFSAFSRSINFPATLAEATHLFNRREISRLVDLVKKKLPRKGRVGILGLAYKPNTDVLDESPGFLLAKVLLHQRIPVFAYDPLAMSNTQAALGNSLRLTKSASLCVQSSDVVVITTPWEEFLRLRPQRRGKHHHRQIVIDCWRMLDPRQWNSHAEYVPLGVGGLR